MFAIAAAVDPAKPRSTVMVSASLGSSVTRSTSPVARSVPTAIRLFFRNSFARPLPLPSSTRIEVAELS